MLLLQHCHVCYDSGLQKDGERVPCTGRVGEALSIAIKIHLLSHTVLSNPCESFFQGGGYSVNYFMFNFQD